jgi:hypothetical protein
MKSKVLLGAFVTLTVASGAGAAPQTPRLPDVVSTGKEAALTDRLVPEKPTVVVFYKPTSSLERNFLQELQTQFGARIGMLVVQLKTGAEPIARQHSITETPTAMVYDRRKRLTGRSSNADEIKAAIAKAAGVMRIDWAEEGDPRFEETAKVLGGRKPTPGILRTMSLKPEYLAYINDLSRKAHFADGFIDRRTKEMIATYVSALNKCKY